LTTEKELLKLAPTLHAAGLVANLIKKKKKKNLIGDATDIIFGSAFIKAESDIIGEM